jgi:hypothetical protein
MHKPEDRSFIGHPRGLAYLAFTEGWELFQLGNAIAARPLHGQQTAAPRTHRAPLRFNLACRSSRQPAGSIAARTDHDALRARVNRRLESVLLGLETSREEIRCDLSAVEIGSNSS